VVISHTDTSRVPIIDKFWSDQDVLFDYKADLHGIGNRSIIY